MSGAPRSLQAGAEPPAPGAGGDPSARPVDEGPPEVPMFVGVGRERNPGAERRVAALLVVLILMLGGAIAAQVWQIRSRDALIIVKVWLDLAPE